MEQKDYKMEIVKSLIHGKNHIRGIARALETNHMMIVRKMKELLGSNVVDFVSEGKNKRYFLKKSPEARAFFIMAENYLVVQSLKKYPCLRDIVQKIQGDKDVKLSLLFGSYAKGLARKNSDIDIFIETENIEIKKKYSAIDSKVSVKIGRLGGDLLSKEIEGNHIILKGGELYYDKFFS
ncbi:MAG: nucleotidyltransferase domain-containing protein [Nanoarchaeota archaeon]|nr:nucleotidyltransferase domain-containing protein [Nanoarchaeota archaeon]